MLRARRRLHRRRRAGRGRQRCRPQTQGCPAAVAPPGALDGCSGSRIIRCAPAVEQMARHPPAMLLLLMPSMAAARGLQNS